jgi:hypothetical protein
MQEPVENRRGAGHVSDELAHSIAERVRKERLASAWRADQEHMLHFADEAARGQIEDLSAFDGRIEREVEVIERHQLAKAGRFHATVDLPLLPHEQLILQNQFQEFGVVELMPGRLLQADIERLRHPYR